MGEHVMGRRGGKSLKHENERMRKAKGRDVQDKKEEKLSNKENLLWQRE